MLVIIYIVILFLHLFVRSMEYVVLHLLTLWKCLVLWLLCLLLISPSAHTEREIGWLLGFQKIIERVVLLLTTVILCHYQMPLQCKGTLLPYNTNSYHHNQMTRMAHFFFTVWLSSSKGISLSCYLQLTVLLFKEGTSFITHITHLGWCSIYSFGQFRQKRSISLPCIRFRAEESLLPTKFYTWQWFTHDGKKWLGADILCSCLNYPRLYIAAEVACIKLFEGLTFQNMTLTTSGSSQARKWRILWRSAAGPFLWRL